MEVMCSLLETCIYFLYSIYMYSTGQTKPNSEHAKKMPRERQENAKC